jgi:hypothetical protein
VLGPFRGDRMRRKKLLCGWRIMMSNLKLFRIKRTALEALSSDELALFIGGGKVLNEMNIGNKQLWFAMNGVNASINSVDRSAAFAMLGYSLRVLAGHVYEARRFLSMKPLLGKNEAAQAEYFDATFVENRKTLTSYFGKKNIIQQIRKNFSFHTDTTLLLRAFETIGSNFEFDLLLSDRYAGHNLFYGSEAIMLGGVQHLKPGSNWEEAVNALFEETTHIAYVVSSVLQRMIGFILAYRLGTTDDDTRAFSIADGPIINDVVVPFFCMPPSDSDQPAS